MKYLNCLIYTFLFLFVLISCKEVPGATEPPQPPNCEEEGIVISSTEVIFRFPKEDVNRLKSLVSKDGNTKLIFGFGKILEKYYKIEPAEFTFKELLEAIVDIEFCACGELSPVLVTFDPTFGIETKLDNLKKDTDEGGVEGDLNFNFTLLPNETPNVVSGFTIYPSPAPEEFKKIKPEFVSPSNNVIAILDTGLDLLGQYSSNGRPTGAKPLVYQYEQAFNAGNCLKEYGGSGWNFVDNNDNFYDDQTGIGHGTLVTKTLTNELDHMGIPNYSILPLKVFDNRGKGSYWKINCAMAYLLEIQENTQNSDSSGDIKLINASFGGSFTALKADELGVMKSFIDGFQDSAIFVASAGNCGEDTDGTDKHFPSGYTSKNIVSVGGYKMGANSDFEKDVSSNFGIQSIDVAAPFTLNKLEVNVLGSDVGTIEVSGTSYSTPLVSAKLFEILFNNLQAKPEDVIREFYNSPNTKKIGNFDSFFKESRVYEAKQK